MRKENPAKPGVFSRGAKPRKIFFWHLQFDGDRDEFAAPFEGDRLVGYRDKPRPMSQETVGPRTIADTD